MKESGASDAYAAYRRVGRVLAVLLVLTAIAEFAWNLRTPTDRDYVSFWAAARLALFGTPQLAYDRAALHAVQLTAARFGAEELPFAYPPAFLILLMPFALLPFAISMAAWSATTFAAYLAVARRALRVPLWIPAAFPPVYANAALGQNGFVTAALFIGGLALLSGWPFAAGLVLGCLIIKPQLALMLPIALVAGLRWRAIAGAAVSSVVILLVGVIGFGPSSTAAWVGQMPLYVTIARDGLVGWHKLTSVYAFGRAVGLSEQLAFAAHGLVALAAALAVWRIWRSDADHLAKMAVLAAATMLASPYLYVYDWLLLLPAYVYLAEQRASPGLVAILWCLPIVVIGEAALGDGMPNIGPFVPMLLLWCIYRRWMDSRPGVVAAAPQ